MGLVFLRILLQYVRGLLGMHSVHKFRDRLRPKAATVKGLGLQVVGSVRALQVLQTLCRRVLPQEHMTYYISGC